MLTGKPAKGRDVEGTISKYREYVLRHAWRGPYQSVGLRPFYLDPSGYPDIVNALTLLRRLHSTHGSASAPMSGTDTEQAILGRARADVPHARNIGTARAMIAFKGIGIISAHTEDARKGARVFGAEIERFYSGGNVGSGRHVRLGDVELKGAGRNVTATRPDWLHSWGGLSFEKAVLELVYARIIDAIAPLGAVRCCGGAFLLSESEPAAYVCREDEGASGPAAILLSLLVRSCDYLRCANLYLPDGEYALLPRPPATLRMIGQQYGMLAGFGVYHMQPTPDNLCVDGRCLDCSSLLVSRTYVAPPTREIVLDGSQRKRVDVSLALREILSSGQVISDVFGGASMRAAWDAIAEVHRRVGWDNRSALESQEWLTFVGRAWFLRQGFGEPMAEELGAKHQQLFLSHYCKTKGKLADAMGRLKWRVGWQIAEPNRRAVYLQPACSLQENELRTVVERHRKYQNLALRDYNKRQLEFASELPSSVQRLQDSVWRALRARQSIDWVESRISTLILRSRPFCPLGRDMVRSLRICRDGSWVRLEGDLGEEIPRARTLRAETRLIVEVLGTPTNRRRRAVSCERTGDGLAWRVEPARGSTWIVQGVEMVSKRGILTTIPLPARIVP